MDANALLEPFERMLATACPPAQVRAIEGGGDSGPLWSELEESGFLDAMVAEESGGAGLSFAETGALIQALGRHAVPVPVAETIVARSLLAAASQDLPAGPIALTTVTTGQAMVVPFGLVCRHVLVDTGHGLVLADAAAGRPEPIGVHGSLAARMQWDGEPAGIAIARPRDGLRPIAAVLRALAIAGAANKLLETTVDFANQRIQFGKPIGRQQAIQQQLAVMAEDAVAARIAAQLGCAGAFPPSITAAATAKSVTSAAAARIANVAHAVHGAIGIAEEFDLQLYTRRLHEWRLSDGSEAWWNRILGARLVGSTDSAIDWIRAEFAN